MSESTHLCRAYYSRPKYESNLLNLGNVESQAYKLLIHTYTSLNFVSDSPVSTGLLDDRLTTNQSVQF